jgi:MFS family permease
LGIWSGSAVMLWYCAVFALTIGRIEPANPATLFTPLIVGAIQAGLLVAIWGIGLLVRWLGQRIRLLVSALVLGIGALVLWIIIAIDVAAVFAVILLGVGLFCAPVWALLCFAFASARLLMVEPASRRATLLHWMLGMTWLAMFFAACRQSVVFSLREYSKLPVHQPGCYIATAAACGHRRFVKSFVRLDDPAGPAANRQLQVFKAFEFLLRSISPAAHRLLRRIYDSIGPKLARRIRNPWLADLAYVTLKPAEWGAAAILWCWLGRERNRIDKLFRLREK